MAQKLIERKIGERFDYNGVTLEVVEQSKDTCDNCYFFFAVNANTLAYAIGYFAAIVNQLFSRR